MLHTVLYLLSIPMIHRHVAFVFVSLPLECEMASIHLRQPRHLIDLLMLTPRARCYLHAGTLCTVLLLIFSGR